ncbi:hypothetical protein AGMMS49992_33660 [Clostridia bacterium]|nr:hypothetical protein AGMMS49992_33660 [Clostridia bacterium]
MAIFKKKPVVETPKEPEDKTPAFLRPLYPYKAVGEHLDVTRLSNPDYITMNNVLYELHCPASDCVLNVRTQGVNVQRMYDKLLEVGCPTCKQKEPFIVRRVVHVPEEILKARMTDDSVAAAQKVAEEYYSRGEYEEHQKEHLEKVRIEIEESKKKTAAEIERIQAQVKAQEVKQAKKKPKSA